ncbi:MAG: hypothetical protein M1422_01435 [Candidatus Thermoplasmatota archaeon]|jgi:hypothetical protein|nr:hypothetical protein [Candidatus Sysuiplasma jiujiangense]MCL4316921.1 hypothetical protein [Candidatus Thermoplasmatota archaeon]
MKKDEIQIIKEQLKDLSIQTTTSVAFPITFNVFVNEMGIYSPDEFPASSSDDSDYDDQYFEYQEADES